MEDNGYSFCIFVMKANRAVAWWGAQVTSCDCDVIEGCCLSVQFYIFSHPELTLYWRYHELIWQRDRERERRCVRWSRLNQVLTCTQKLDTNSGGLLQWCCTPLCRWAQSLHHWLWGSKHEVRVAPLTPRRVPHRLEGKMEWHRSHPGH